jgi:hypothetical protein
LDYVLGYSQLDLSKLRGGSPRIHAGELGCQAERLRVGLSSSGFSSRGFEAGAKARAIEVRLFSRR